jgi:hypothetical protein
MVLDPQRKKEIKQRLLKAMLLESRSDNSAIKLTKGYYLEGIDFKHRDKQVLNEMYSKWETTSDTKENKSFWKWLKENKPEFENSKQVKFLTSKERRKHLVVVGDDNRLRQGAQGEPYDTSSFKGKTPGKAAYVVDSKGNMYVGEHKKGLMHHSSFLAGRAVVSAGMVKIENGKITEIDHRSGHYAPGGEQLRNALNNINKDCFSDNAVISFSDAIKSETKQYIADKLINIKENKYLNWLPTTVLSKLVQLGTSMAHNNQKEEQTSAQDYYNSSEKDTPEEEITKVGLGHP